MVRHTMDLVWFCENCDFLCRVASHEAFLGALRLIERVASYGGAGFFFDLQLISIAEFYDNSVQLTCDRETTDVCYTYTNMKTNIDNLPKLTYLADQGPLAHFPSEIASFSSPYELTSTMLLQERNRVNCSKQLCAKAVTQRKGNILEKADIHRRYGAFLNIIAIQNTIYVNQQNTINLFV